MRIADMPLTRERVAAGLVCKVQVCIKVRRAKRGKVMMQAISGFWAAVPSPLAADGTVDDQRLGAHAMRLFEKGVEGVVLFGTTGEGTSFAIPERLASVEALLKSGIATDRI